MIPSLQLAINFLRVEPSNRTAGSWLRLATNNAGASTCSFACHSTGMVHNSTMVSTFGWIATDARQRRNMLEAIDQFKDESTVDDLGLGVIRDAISDTLFPGTSTLHTRIRYALFIPWQLQIAAETYDNVIDMRRAFHDSEYQLIEALSNGGETVGVIGRVAGTTLQRTPSSVYWGMLTRWGIFQPGFSIEDFFDRHLKRQAQRNAIRADDPDWRPDFIDTGLHPKLPPPPPGMLDEATFTLREEDGEFLRHAITHRASNTLLAHLVEHKPRAWVDQLNPPTSFAAPEILAELPATLYNSVTTVNKFAVGIHGANLMYNYLLAKHTQRVERDELLEDRYAACINDWFVDAREA